MLEREMVSVVLRSSRTGMPVGHLLDLTTRGGTRVETRAAATGLMRGGVKRRRHLRQGSRSGGDHAGNS